MEIATARLRADCFFQDRILAHCTRLARKSELLFVVCLTVISVAVSAVTELALSALGIGTYETPALLLRGGVVLPFVLLVIFAPLLETFLLQQLPIAVGNKLGMPRVVQFLMGSMPFAAVHFNTGVVSGLAAGVVGGVVLSLAYLTFYPESKGKAFLMTAAVHALHNLFAAVMLVRELS